VTGGGTAAAEAWILTAGAAVCEGAGSTGAEVAKTATYWPRAACWATRTSQAATQPAAGPWPPAEPR
jgi:hypothetical protein